MKEVNNQGQSLEKIPDIEEKEPFILNLDNNAIKCLDKAPRNCSHLILSNNK